MPTPFVRLMTDNGIITGNSAMNVNGSVTPVTFYLLSQPNETWVISHLIITLACAAAPSMGDFGSIAGGLANGCDIQFNTGAIIVNPLGSFTFKKNYHFGLFGGPVISGYSGPSQTLTINFELDAVTDTPGISLDGNLGQSYGFRVRDNLSALIDMRIAVFGERYSI